MKYLTPERYLRLDNLSNEQAFLAAQQQWEEALTSYQEQLQRIWKQLPRALQKLLKSVYLHDSRVLTMHQIDQEFFITLQPPSDPGRLVVLGYSLVEEPSVEQDVLPQDRRREPIEWLYDELDLDRPEGPRGLPPSSDKPTMRHNILLSNGWEVTLRFRSIWVKRPIRVIPVLPLQRNGQPVGQGTPNSLEQGKTDPE
jgi:hypothetical protein